MRYKVSLSRPSCGCLIKQKRYGKYLPCAGCTLYPALEWNESGRTTIFFEKDAVYKDGRLLWYWIPVKYSATSEDR